MTTTMKELVEWQPPPADETYHQALIHTLESLYPEGWKDWVVKKVTLKDLFGESLTPDTEARLRFAVPTLRLARIFKCEKSLSERRYKALKRKLLEWPIGLALIYQPLSVMARVHPNVPQNKFDTILPELKKHLISRKEASDILKAEVRDSMSTTSSRSPSSKRLHTPDPEPRPKKQKLVKDNHSPETLSEYMRQQNEILGRLCEITYGLTQQQTARCHSPAPKESTNRSLASSEEDSATNERNSEIEEHWNAPPLIEDAELKDEPLLDFAPETKESDAKVGKASPKMVEAGALCQKLETEGWHNIRYAEVQKMFQATPVFTALKVNGHLATATPPWHLVSTLEKIDLCLGAITHGLLQQRTAFEETYAGAPSDVKTHLSKHFLSKDKAFRKVSDAILQYTCGKRAEAIEQRRALYKPQNKTISELLHTIPPSRTHLFAEPQLSDLIKEQGGVSKVFPGRFKRPNMAGTVKPKNRQGFKQKPTFRKQNRRAPEKSTRNFGHQHNKQPAKNKAFEGKRH